MDTIKIYGIEFYAYHGVLDSEKELGQTFRIDCEFSLDSSVCNDDIDKTVNYGQVDLDIKEFASQNRYDLLESLANKLARYLLQKYELMDDIKLVVHKPHAPIATKFDDVTMTVRRKRERAYLAIGSNLGDRKGNLDYVGKAIDSDPSIKLLAKSSYIETKPYGVLDQPDFLNGAIKVETIYTPKELLDFCKRTEKLAGRVATRRWGERVLDVDILMYGSDTVFTDDLIIPHPEMHIRDFVLRPLEEIEPHLIHPIKNKSIRELLKEVE